MRISRVVARVNKVVTNPIQRRWADRLAPWAMVEHVGRRTGTRYRTPVVAFVDGDKIAIPLPYGTDTDWLRNVTAAGRFTLVRKRVPLTIVGLRVVPGDSPDIPRAGQLPARVARAALFGRITDLP